MIGKNDNIQKYVFWWLVFCEKMGVDTSFNFMHGTPSHLKGLADRMVRPSLRDIDVVAVEAAPLNTEPLKDEQGNTINVAVVENATQLSNAIANAATDNVRVIVVKGNIANLNSFVLGENQTITGGKHLFSVNGDPFFPTFSSGGSLQAAPGQNLLEVGLNNTVRDLNLTVDNPNTNKALFTGTNTPLNFGQLTVSGVRSIGAVDLVSNEDNISIDNTFANNSVSIVEPTFILNLVDATNLSELNAALSNSNVTDIAVQGSISSVGNITLSEGKSITGRYYTHSNNIDIQVSNGGTLNQAGTIFVTKDNIVRDLVLRTSNVTSAISFNNSTSDKGDITVRGVDADANFSFTLIGGQANLRIIDNIINSNRTAIDLGTLGGVGTINAIQISGNTINVNDHRYVGILSYNSGGTITIGNIENNNITMTGSGNFSPFSAGGSGIVNYVVGGNRIHVTGAIRNNTINISGTLYAVNGFGNSSPYSLRSGIVNYIQGLDISNASIQIDGGIYNNNITTTITGLEYSSGSLSLDNVAGIVVGYYGTSGSNINMSVNGIYNNTINVNSSVNLQDLLPILSGISVSAPFDGAPSGSLNIASGIYNNHITVNSPYSTGIKLLGANTAGINIQSAFYGNVVTNTGISSSSIFINAAIHTGAVNIAVGRGVGSGASLLQTENTLSPNSVLTSPTVNINP